MQKKHAKWLLLKEERLCKAAIKDRKALAKENKALAKLLAEKNKIMTMNRNEMDNITKEWHDMARREILKRRMIAARSDGFGVGGGIGGGGGEW
ncbi:ALA-interacting subunit 1 [Hordeum vulgare]|nr:ALA-interacting subunit 1 [Hordeum vulgare]